MDKLEYVARSLSRGTNKKYETYVINAIYQKVNNPNLIIETQKEIKLENGYRPLIDLFLPQLNIESKLTKDITLMKNSMNMIFGEKNRLILKFVKLVSALTFNLSV